MKEEPAVEDFELKELPVKEMMVQKNVPVNSHPDLSNNASKDRVSKLRNLSMKLDNPVAISEMEKQPAYLRRGTSIKDIHHSSESNLSQYYVENSDDPDKMPELKKNNSFLHGNDKVD